MQSSPDMTVMTYYSLIAEASPIGKAYPEIVSWHTSGGPTMRALVVDDEAAVQRLVVRGLIQQGFACDTAADGNEAEERVSKAHYDVVITDLKMPNKHGHALAVYLLALEPRPVIIVHTGVVEPKLAKDLLARGVDDIVFKPFDFGLLAAKVKALVERKSPLSSQVQKATKPTTGEMQVELLDNASVGIPVSLADIESRLSGLSRILPISTSGLDVYNMTSTNEWEIPQIAAAIQRDATLAAEVLRLANSAFYNTSGQQIVQLERAVLQIGQKRIGEVALASNALTALTSNLVPWMNVGLTWKRSMAAGLAVEMLIDEGKYQQVEQGVLLSAIMHPLGRIVLGTLYPKQYETMVEKCRVTDDRLLEHEGGMFPINHAEAMALLLASWGIPDEIHLPLKYLLADSASLSKVPDSIRNKVELLTLSIFLGNLAIGAWEAWDVVDVPSAALLRKHDGSRISEIVKRTKNEVEELAAFRTARPDASKLGQQAPPPRELAYCDLSGGPVDLLGEIVSTMGIKLVRCSADDLNDCEERLLVNCIGTSPQRLAAKTRRASFQSLIIVTDAERVEKYGEYGQAVVLPISYGRLRAICWEASHRIRQTQECVDSSFSLLA
jgi:HD-like signal output (HDOD) protein/DNA-binding NarL/FixJ family response regulator